MSSASLLRRLSYSAWQWKAWICWVLWWFILTLNLNSAFPLWCSCSVKPTERTAVVNQTRRPTKPKYHYYYYYYWEFILIWEIIMSQIKVLELQLRGKISEGSFDTRWWFRFCLFQIQSIQVFFQQWYFKAHVFFLVSETSDVCFLLVLFVFYSSPSPLYILGRLCINTIRKSWKQREKGICLTRSDHLYLTGKHVLEREREIYYSHCKYPYLILSSW